jgi:hypothetical protein
VVAGYQRHGQSPGRPVIDVTGWDRLASPEAHELPNDVETLKGLVISQQIELEKVRFEIACLKRARYGRSSEQVDARLTQTPGSHR